jgi:hypothetical protein
VIPSTRFDFLLVSVDWWVERAIMSFYDIEEGILEFSNILGDSVTSGSGHLKWYWYLGREDEKKKTWLMSSSKTFVSRTDEISVSNDGTLDLTISYTSKRSVLEKL